MPKKDKDGAWLARTCADLAMSLWWVIVILGLGILGGYVLSRLQ